MTFTSPNPMLLDAVIKVTLLLAAAGAASLALARASASARHLVWTFALTGALVLPVLSVALPRWQLPLVTFTTPAPEVVNTDVDVAAPPIRRSPSRATVSQSVANNTIAAEPTAFAGWTPTSVLLTIWIAGAALVLSRLLLGIVAVQWMARRTSRVLNAPWLPLAVELAQEIGIRYRVAFLESNSATMPMAFGIVRPAVLMPADAGRWPIERLRIVLLHELAHVKRRDCLTHAVAQIACAAYWFNPLVWIAARHRARGAPITRRNCWKSRVSCAPAISPD